MRKLLILSVIFVATTLFAQNADAKTNAAPAKNVQAAPEVEEASNALLGISESSFNFGYAPAGYKMTHHYVLKSLGEEALKIKQVRATCGCTAAAPEKDILEPGDSTTVRVTFNSRGYDKRNARKSIRVTSNDKEKKVKNLSFNVNCDTTKYAYLKPDPVAVDLGKGDDVLTETKFIVNNISEEELALEIVSYDYDNIEKITFADETIKAGASTEVTVTMLEEVKDKTKATASVTLQAKGNEKSRFTVPVAVNNFKATPRTSHNRHKDVRKEK